jgi:hypothetical protein
VHLQRFASNLDDLSSESFEIFSSACFFSIGFLGLGFPFLFLISVAVNPIKGDDDRQLSSPLERTPYYRVETPILCTWPIPPDFGRTPNHRRCECESVASRRRRVSNMHFIPHSRSAAGLFAIILSSSAIFADAATPSSRAECVRDRSRELAQLAACGHEGSLNYCFSNLPEFFLQTDLETCFQNAGCTLDESSIEAFWTLRRCETPENLGDLRRRQNNRPAATPQDDPDPNAPATTQQPAKQTTQAKNTQPATTQKAATTQKPAQTTQAAQQQTTSQPSEDVVIVTQTVGTTSADAQSAGTTNTRLTCIITTTQDITTCPLQSTGPRSGRETLSCFPTQISFPTCSPGLFCSSDPQGGPTCMKLNNTLDTGGVIIALFFAIAITAAIGMITFLCCKEKAQQRKLAAKAEAAAIAKAAAVGAGAAATTRTRTGMRNVSAQSVNDRQPLMADQPPQGYGHGPQEHQDPFHDRHHM